MHRRQVKDELSAETDYFSYKYNQLGDNTSDTEHLMLYRATQDITGTSDEVGGFTITWTNLG